MDLVEELWASDTASALTNRAAREITRLRTRLEIIPGTEIDGIDCRDETIRLQDAEIGRLRDENARLQQDNEQAKEAIQTLNAGRPLGDIVGKHTAQNALAENARLRADAAECDALRSKLADILTRTANALKGEPAPLHLHSWHDLPECARRLRADAGRLNWLDAVNLGTNERNETVYGWKFDINHNRAALTDHNSPALSVRAAIDAAMQKGG